MAVCRPLVSLPDNRSPPPSGTQHACTIILKVNFRDVPRVPPAEQIETEDLAPAFWRVMVYYGFKDHPDVPDVVARLPALGLPVDPAAVSYFLSRSIRGAAGGDGPAVRAVQDMALWRKFLFAVAFRNSTSAVTYYGLPGDAVIELGVQAHI